MRIGSLGFICGMAMTMATWAGAQTGGGKPAPKKTSAAAPVNAKGKEVYRLNCAICHHSDSLEKKVGPGMKNIYKRKFADGSKVDDASMRAWIEKGGKDMPPFKEVLTAEQIADLLAYMRGL